MDSKVLQEETFLRYEQKIKESPPKIEFLDQPFAPAKSCRSRKSAKALSKGQEQVVCTPPPRPQDPLCVLNLCKSLSNIHNQDQKYQQKLLDIEEKLKDLKL